MENKRILIVCFSLLLSISLSSTYKNINLRKQFVTEVLIA